MPGPSLLSSTTQQSSAKPPTPSGTPQPQQASMTPKPNYDPFSSLANSKSSSKSTTPVPSLLQSQLASKPPQPPLDPFAALASPAPRQPSPFLNSQQSQPPNQSPSASLFDFAQPSRQQNPITSQSGPLIQSNGSTAEEDWNFSSALPDESASLPSSKDLSVSNSTVAILFKLSRPSNKESVVAINAHFSNTSANLITEYTFQVAVRKVRTLHYFPVHLSSIDPVCRDTVSILHLKLGGHFSRSKKTALRSPSKSMEWLKGRQIRSRCAGKHRTRSRVLYGRSKERFLRLASSELVLCSSWR